MLEGQKYFNTAGTTFPHSFGMVMQERSYSGPVNRFGFNGKEKENEINVDAGDYDFGARIYDSRLGRWLSLDPLTRKYPDYSPYIAFINNPLFFIDVEGKDILVYFAEDTEKKHPLAKIESTEFKGEFNIPKGIKSQLYPDNPQTNEQNFPKEPIISINLDSYKDKINWSPSENDKKADAHMTSLGLTAAALAGWQFEVDVVTILKGQDKGGEFMYFSWGTGFGAGVGLSVSTGNLEVKDDFKKSFDRNTFSGESKSTSFAGAIGVTHVTGYKEPEVDCPIPLTDCGYTPTYEGTLVTAGLLNPKAGGGVFNMHASEPLNLVCPESPKPQDNCH